MARSPLTLAASVTSALPRAGVVGVAELSEGAAGRYDSAVAQLDDGRQVVVRVAVDGAAASELAAQTRALRALTSGVRALLPFRAPLLLGETGMIDGRAVVVDYVPGYRVDAAHLPAGRGAATSIGRALAAVHTLPVSILRTEGIVARTPEQLRDELARLLDRLAATHRIPIGLLGRWRRAAETDQLWRFETTVVLGGASADAFLLEDDEVEVPAVAALLDWHGLSGGDPAVDLQWLASAPAAADDVFAAYAAASRRAPDAGIRARARLYAELEFAKWLLHGLDEGRDDIVGDAEGLLGSLADGVRGDDLAADADVDVDEAIAFLERMPSAEAPDADTSMQTDAYDPGTLSMFVDDEESSDPLPAAAHVNADAEQGGAADTLPVRGAGARRGADVGAATAPIDLSAWASGREPGASERRAGAPTAAADETAPNDQDAADEAGRAARAALQRWASSGSE